MLTKFTSYKNKILIDYVQSIMKDAEVIARNGAIIGPHDILSWYDIEEISILDKDQRIMIDMLNSLKITGYLNDSGTTNIVVETPYRKTSGIVSYVSSTYEHKAKPIQVFKELYSQDIFSIISDALKELNKELKNDYIDDMRLMKEHYLPDSNYASFVFVDGNDNEYIIEIDHSPDIPKTNVYVRIPSINQSQSYRWTRDE